ncbi:hypothetical protein [Roseiarcus sp.]|uniref:hypothetical protein n=1 Tax=Roseiarcus sp. TaxID=1969460 RepID=UPI003C686BE9
MGRSTNILGFAVLVGAVMASAPAVFADENHRSKMTCKSVDEGAPQSIGDPEGRMIAVYDVTCTVVEGSPQGGVYNGRSIVEWDNTHSSLIAGGGVMRSLGSIVVVQNIKEDGEASLTAGKVTGFASSGLSWTPDLGPLAKV